MTPADNRSSRSRRRLLFAILGLPVVAALACEIFLRIAFGLGNPVLVQADASCGYVLKPNQKVRRFSVNTLINDFGMRSAYFSRTKPASTTRIMMLGDSIVYGTAQVDQSLIFSELVRRRCEETLKHPVEMLNASVPAWAIGNEFAYVKSRGLFASNLLLVVINKGDVTQDFSTLKDVGDGLPTTAPATAVGELASRIFLIIRGRRAKLDAGIFETNIPKEKALANFRLLTAICSLARQNNVPVIIIYLPLRRDVNLDQPASAPDILSNWAAAEKVPLFDLTSAESHYQDTQIELPDHAHFNRLGNEVIAKSLLPIVLRMVCPPKNVN